MGKKNMLAKVDLSHVDEKPRWYTVVTLFNYEEKYIDNLLRSISGTQFEQLVTDTFVPIKETTETVKLKSGTKQKIKKEKIYPMYVFVKCNMTEDLWGKLRSITGASVVLTTGGIPIPISEDDIDRMKIACNKYVESENKEKEEFSIGSYVAITTGTFEGFKGQIEILDEKSKTVKMRVYNSLVDISMDDIKLAS